MAASNTIVSPGDCSIKILKWKVKKDSTVMKGSVLAIYETQESKSQLKLKSSGTGIVDEISVEAGSQTKPGEVLITLRQQASGGCSHPTVMKDMCADCGADLRKETTITSNRKKVMSASVAMVHNIPELIVSQEQALELGREDEQRLLKTRKLVLLVDLDQTLIHTTNDAIPHNLKDVHHFKMWQGNRPSWYHTRLRPHTMDFLQHVSKMFELHICTFGVRLYAHTVARLIDPDEKYFSHRILSRDECFDPLSKTANLKALFPCGDGMVCIIDDREDVWNRAPNLVQVKPYHFFQGTADINAPPGLEKSENDNVPVVHKVLDRRSSTSSTSGVTKGCAVEGMTGEAKDIPSDKQATADAGSNVNDQGSQKMAGKEDKTEETVLTNAVLSVSAADALTQSKTDEACQRSTAEDRLSNSAADVETKVEMETEEPKIPTAEEENGCKIAESEMEAQKSGPSAEDELMHDLSMSSDSDEDTGRQSPSGSSGDDGDSSGQSVDIPDTKQIPHNTNIEEPMVTQEVPAPVDSNSDVLNVDVEKSTKSSSEEQAVCEDSSNSCEPHSKSFDISDQTPGAEEETKRTISGEHKTELNKEVNTEVTKDTGDDDLMEWDDEDDYLLHLKDILTRVHQAFYAMVDESCKQPAKQSESTDLKSGLPDLKSLIPYVKRKTLKDCNIVFSGLVPLNTKLEKSPAYMIAKALGATVQTEIVGPSKAGKKGPATTHLVAAKPGTNKHKTAQRTPGVLIVSSAWLWACNERWDRCDERIFALGSPLVCLDSSSNSMKHGMKKTNKKRKRILHDSDRDDSTVREKDYSKRLKTNHGEDRLSEEFSDSSERGESLFGDNAATAFRILDKDKECLLKEVDEALAEELTGSDSEDETDEERDKRYRDTVLGSKENSDSSSDSLSGEFPRGWHLRRKIKSSPHSSEDDLDKQQKSLLEQEAETEDTENELVRFQKTVETFSPDSDCDSDTYAESIGSVDDEIADAVEKEFLGSL